jgi:hypothetical protein
MNTMIHYALCIVPDAPCARIVVDDLRAAGFPSQDISVVVPEKPGTRDLAFGRIGGDENVGVVVIPGLGSFVASGTLLDVLLPAQRDLPAGVSLRLAALGLPQFDAKQYERRLRSGHALSMVRVHGNVETTRAIEIFERHQGEIIGVAEPELGPD